MNILNAIINTYYPHAELSCPECGHTDIIALESNQVSLSNPLGERMMGIKCNKCGAVDNAVNETNVIETVKAWLITTTPSYVCFYELDGVEQDTAAERLDVFKEGFWINNDFDYTNGSDAKYWIPPGRIHYVTKATKVKRLSE